MGQRDIYLYLYIHYVSLFTNTKYLYSLYKSERGDGETWEWWVSLGERQKWQYVCYELELKETISMIFILNQYIIFLYF